MKKQLLDLEYAGEVYASNGARLAESYPDRGEELESGMIYAANADRFTGASFQDALTEYTVGWTDDSGIQAVLDFLAPPIPVSMRRFEYKLNTNTEVFMTDLEDQDIRGIGQDPKRVEYTRTDETSRVFNKSLMVRVDEEEYYDGWEEDYTDRLIQRLLRNDLNRALTLALANATNTAVTWHTNGSTYSNPDSDARTALIASANDSGLRANRILYDENSWAYRQAAYENPASSTYQGGYSRSTMSMEQVASVLRVDSIMELKSRYQSTASAKALLMSGKVLMFYATPGAKKNDPSNLKRFIGNTQSGGPYRTFLRVQAQYTDLIVEAFTNPLVTSTQGSQKLTVTSSS